MTKRQGAPRKSPDIAKSKVFQLRLTETEKEAFRLAAERDGKTLSDWIRDRLRRVSRQELQEHGDEVPFLARKGKKTE